MVDLILTLIESYSVGLILGSNVSIAHLNSILDSEISPGKLTVVYMSSLEGRIGEVGAAPIKNTSST